MSSELPSLVVEFGKAVDDAANRVVAMEQIVIESLTGTAGVQAEKYPGFEYNYKNLYWRNSVGGYTPQPSSNTEFAIKVPMVAELVAGAVDEGFEGTLPTLLMWTWVPTIVAYFTNCRGLVYLRGQGQTPPRFWEDVGLTITFQSVQTADGSDSTKLLVARFSLALPFKVHLDRSLA